MNRIFIDSFENEVEPRAYLLSESFTLEANSEYSSFGELLPGGVNELIQVVTTASTTGGTVSKGVQYMQSVIDLKRWVKTNPIALDFTLKFYVQNDPEKDVFDPVNFFQALSVLSYDNSSDMYSTPGPNLSTLKEMSSAINNSGAKKLKFSDKPVTDTKKYPKKNKMFSLWIPGVVYIPIAFIESVRPTYSPHTVYGTDMSTEYPLWVELQLRVSGVTPANDTMFLKSNVITIGTELAADSIAFSAINDMGQGLERAAKNALTEGS